MYEEMCANFHSFASKVINGRAQRQPCLHIPPLCKDFKTFQDALMKEKPYSLPYDRVPDRVALRGECLSSRLWKLL